MCKHVWLKISSYISCLLRHDKCMFIHFFFMSNACPGQHETRWLKCPFAAVRGVAECLQRQIATDLCGTQWLCYIALCKAHKFLVHGTYQVNSVDNIITEIHQICMWYAGPSTDGTAHSGNARLGSGRCTVSIVSWHEEWVVYDGSRGSMSHQGKKGLDGFDSTEIQELITHVLSNVLVNAD